MNTIIILSTLAVVAEKQPMDWPEAFAIVGSPLAVALMAWALAWLLKNS